MSEFGRCFAVERIVGFADQPEGAWWRDILRLWRPAGVLIDYGESEAGELTDLGLRLAVRNGYLNFYRQGQSVARVSFDRRGRPIAELHAKYAGARADGPYVTLGAEGWSKGLDVPPYQEGSTAAEWVGRATKYRGDEKRFVDEVVGVDPNVVDLEIGLPADRQVPPGERRAQRIDLAALEPHDDRWRLVFWEVKLERDARLVAYQEPHIVEQVRLYRTFLERCETRVCAEYANNCRVLQQLAAEAYKVGNPVQLGASIEQVARRGEEAIVVDKEPRLLIHNTGVRRADVWSKHLQRLKMDFGLTVISVETPRALNVA